MESPTGLYLVRPRRSRERRQSLVPVIVFAILAICGALAPPVLLAAQTPVDTQRNPGVVFMVILLLFGSMAAGLVFASPLRGRLIRTPSGSRGGGDATLARHAWPGRRATDEGVVRPVARRPEPTYAPEGHEIEEHMVTFDPSVRYGTPRQFAHPAQRARSAESPAPVPWPQTAERQPTATDAPSAPHTPTPTPTQTPPQARSRPAPWSTSSPQPDSNWEPIRGQRPAERAP